jgi:hypothetical protein
VLDVESVSEEIIKKIGDYLGARMPTLEQIIYEFPTANTQLKYPSLSIIQVGDADYAPEMNPYIHSQGSIINHKADIRYVVGKYDFKLQLDIWCRNKKERNDLYQEFFKAFNSQFPKMGLSLNFTDYYNIICRYDMISFMKEDSEVTSQTREWRIKIRLLANCDALLEKNEYIVESLESHTEIPHEVEEIKSI